MNLSRRTFAKMGIAGTVAVGAAGLLRPPARSDTPPSGNTGRCDTGPKRRPGSRPVCGRLLVDRRRAVLAGRRAQRRRRPKPAEHSHRCSGRDPKGLSQQPGPVVLGGHSWSGTLVSEVGIEPSVSALVYIAGRAPDAHEDFPALSKRFPTPPASAGVVVSPDGYAELDEATFLRDFAGGVPAERARALCAVQAAPCPLSARPWPPGAISRAGIRCPPRTGPSTRISNVSLPNGWARTRSNSIPRTFRSSLSPSRSPG